MDCHGFETHLESLLDDKLEPVEKRACLQHATTCNACGELLTAVGGLLPGVGTEPVASLVDAVLESTIGSACGKARDSLPAYVDRDLVSADQELIGLHLETCGECRKLLSTLNFLQRELPRLAEAAVDNDFAGEVLAATLPSRTRLKRWWLSHWSGWVHRPRFAMEAAYVGLLVVLLVLGAFSTPVAALPLQGLRLVQADPETPSVWTQTNQGLGTFWDWVASLFEKVEQQPESTEESP